MLNWSLLQNLLVIATACSSITIILIQKTKKFFKKSNWIIVYGLFINMMMGYLFCQTFSNVDYMKSLWVGLFSFLGADTIYKNLEGKLKSHSELIGTSIDNTKKTDLDSQKDILPPTPSIEEDSTQVPVSSIAENKSNENQDVIGEITYE